MTEGAPHAEEPAAEPDGDVAFSFGVFVAALLPRLYVAIAWAREAVWDGHFYDFGARRIAAGLGYSDDLMTPSGPVWHPWAHYPVGYSAFLGLLYRVFGAEPPVGTVANAIVGAGLAVLVHRVARAALSRRRARIASLLCAFSPGLIAYAALLMTEVLAAAAMMLSIWIMLRPKPRALLARAALAGGCMGLACLVRPQSLLLAPMLAVIAWTPSDTLASFARRAASSAFVALTAALIAILPWSIRNCRVMDGCALVSTNAGWNLAIGSFPRATGRFETLRSSDGCAVVTGQVQQDRCWMSRGMAWIAEDPARWLALVPEKLSQTFDHESFPMGYLGEADPVRWTPERKEQGRGILTTAHRLLLSAAPLGFLARGPLRTAATTTKRLVVGWLPALAIVAYAAYAFLSDEHPFWPLAIVATCLALIRIPRGPSRSGLLVYFGIVVGSVCLTHAIFFGEDRYHVVATPVLCILAAAALREPSAQSGLRTQRNPSAGTS